MNEKKIDFSKGNYFITVADNSASSPIPKAYLHLISSEACVKEARRHRKRRINKKWVKRYGKKLIPSDTCYICFGDKLIGHPKMLEKIANACLDSDCFKVVSRGTDFGFVTTKNYIDVNSEEG